MSGAIFRVTLACLLALSCAQGGGSAFTDDDGELSQGGSDNLPCGIDCSGIVGAQCQVGVCDEATLQCKLVPAADGGECDDGLFCTLDDACVAGECTGGRANECDLAATGCTEITCNESTKTCTNTTLPNGASCVSTDLCVIGGTCTNGQCIGTLNDCFFAPVPNQCHVAVCNPSTGTCDPIPGNFGTACTDFDDLCTVGKTCDTQGTCQGGAPKDCSSLSVGCNNGLCNTTNGQCYPDPIPDGMTCAQATDDCNQGYCSSGVCNPTPINETLG